MSAFDCLPLTDLTGFNSPLERQDFCQAKRDYSRSAYSLAAAEDNCLSIFKRGMFGFRLDDHIP